MHVLVASYSWWWEWAAGGVGGGRAELVVQTGAGRLEVPVGLADRGDPWRAVCPAAAGPARARAEEGEGGGGGRPRCEAAVWAGRAAVACAAAAAACAACMCVLRAPLPPRPPPNEAAAAAAVAVAEARVALVTCGNCGHCRAPAGASSACSGDGDAGSCSPFSVLVGDTVAEAEARGMLLAWGMVSSPPPPPLPPHPQPPRPPSPPPPPRVAGAPDPREEHLAHPAGSAPDGAAYATAAAAASRPPRRESAPLAARAITFPPPPPADLPESPAPTRADTTAKEPQPAAAVPDAVAPPRLVGPVPVRRPLVGGAAAAGRPGSDRRDSAPAAATSKASHPAAAATAPRSPAWGAMRHGGPLAAGAAVESSSACGWGQRGEPGPLGPSALLPPCPAAGASGSCLGGNGSEGCEEERVVVGVVTGRVEGGKFRVSFPHPLSTPVPYIDLLLPSPHVRLL